MGRLETLHIANFRGASNPLTLEFDSKRPIAVIFGENGTGKSTIADALDALGNGVAGSLADRSSVNAKEHLPTLGKESKDICITLKAGGLTWTSSVGKGGVPVSAPPRPAIRVLRRSPLLRMVNEKPSDRYKVLQGFIDIQGVEKSEEALYKAWTNAKQDRDANIRQRVQAEAQLREAWDQEKQPGPDHLQWAAGVAASNTEALEGKARALREAVTAIQNAERYLNDYDSARRIRAEKQEEASKVEAEIAKLPTATSQEVMALTGLLGQASAFLAKWSQEDQCPVCEQGIPLDRLKADIKRRIDHYGAYDSARRKQEAAAQTLLAQDQALALQLGQLLRATRPLLAMLNGTELGPLAALQLSPASYPDLEKSEGDPSWLAIDQARMLIGLLSPLCPTMEGEIQGAMAKVNRRGLITGLRNTFLESVRESEFQNLICSALESTLELARRTRRDYTQKILDEVRDECNRLYLAIHPEERLTLSNLKLDPEQRASLLQQANFEARADVPPQAYFSESHLDTLAFCFWLALAKREFPNGEVLLVLDDVFTSVDAQHLERIAQLIVEESKHFAHVLLLTHQRRWWEHFRSPHGAGKFAQGIRLDRWSLAQGIRFQSDRLEVGELLEALRNVSSDRQRAASKAGILLERILEGLGRRYRCAAPWNAHGGPNLSELLDGTSSLFKVLEIHRPERDPSGQTRDPVRLVPSKPKETFDRIRGHAFVRSWVGAHHNPHGADLPDAEVESFVAETVRFVEALSCAECGQIPSRRAGSHFACSCPPESAVRMLPYQS